MATAEWVKSKLLAGYTVDMLSDTHNVRLYPSMISCVRENDAGEMLIHKVSYEGCAVTAFR